MHLTNEEILRGLRTHNEEVRNEVCKTLGGKLIGRFSNRYKVNIEDVKDLFSDTFLCAEKWIKGKTKGANGINFNGDFYNHLYSIMLRLWIKQLEINKRNDKVIDKLIKEQKSIQHAEGEEDFFSMELNEIAYRECLEKLPEQWKALLDELFSKKIQFKTNDERKRDLGFNTMNDYYNVKSKSLKRINECLENNPKYDPLI